MTLVARALITGGIIAFMVLSAPYANAGTSPEEVKKFEDFKERGRTRGQAVTRTRLILNTKVEGGFGIRKLW